MEICNGTVQVAESEDGTMKIDDEQIEELARLLEMEKVKILELFFTMESLHLCKSRLKKVKYDGVEGEIREFY